MSKKVTFSIETKKEKIVEGDIGSKPKPKSLHLNQFDLLSLLNLHDYKTFIKVMIFDSDLSSRPLIKQKLTLLNEECIVIKNFIDSMITFDMKQSTEIISEVLGLLLKILPETVEEVFNEYLITTLDFNELADNQLKIVYNLFERAYKNKNSFVLNTELLEDSEHSGSTEIFGSDTEEISDLMDIEDGDVFILGDNNIDNPFLDNSEEE